VNVFDLHRRVIGEYADYTRSFHVIADEHIRELVDRELDAGLLWPEPLVQLNPAFEPGEPLEHLVDAGELHPECLRIFASKDEDGRVRSVFRLHQHQVESIHAARARDNYVLTTGTGSGKSLSYIVPIVDHVLRQGSGRGIQAIVVYPMNALANSQVGELEKFLCRGFPKGRPPVTFRRYTGQESLAERKEIVAGPPDILLTNYVMLELVLTRPWDTQLVEAARGLRFLVLDELHTYRGRQGADVGLLVRRVREACQATELLHIGTSATLASGGTWPEQQREVAAVATELFGSTVKPERVIGETLRRVTPEPDVDSREFRRRLAARLASDEALQPGDPDALMGDPVAAWIESTLGLTLEEDSGRLIRSAPLALGGESGAAARLAEATGVDRPSCENAIRETLLSGHLAKDKHGWPLFAFRLHQFVSKGESVYASLQPEDTRHLTVHAQQFVPDSDRELALLPLAFCRECGQDYYVVRRGADDQGRVRHQPRQVSDRYENDDGEAGYLYLSQYNPWPEAPAEIVDRVPDAWLEVQKGQVVVRRHQRQNLPKRITISGLGIEGEGVQIAWWLPAPFRFCLRCGVAYDARQGDFGKLATLGSEGRSTATTVMTLSAIRSLRRDEDLEDRARKLLSFTDNRQDASLQAGHFNDFVGIAVLRSALRRAVEAAGDEGLRHDKLTLRVFQALDLPLGLYAENPGVEYAAREETDRALREVLGYYIYRDLRRGWRVTSPNLEQCGLLEIDYQSLVEFCRDDGKWVGRHPALATAAPGNREKVSRTLLDHLRRELAIRVSYLDPVEQESIKQLSRQRLVAPWTMDDTEKPEASSLALPVGRGKERAETGRFLYISPRGGFGQFLGRSGTFPAFDGNLKLEDKTRVIKDLLAVLHDPAGLLHRIEDPKKGESVHGYQLSAAGMVWRAGTGQRAFGDPIRVPREPEGGLRTNEYFKTFYRADTTDLKDLESHEHTAQVQAKVREEREEAFREARLPVLYCSPTMELGVDIAQLNVVSLRNVPPTPANYAQRSGRAGRSGQPAFVFTYCAGGSPHDQYFFKRPERMVAGAVTPPRLDLVNEELLAAHVHAIWLSASGLDLGSSLSDVLDVAGDEPTLELQDKVRSALGDHHARSRAKKAALAVLHEPVGALVAPDGSAEAWIDQILSGLRVSFEEACARWRGLYRAALDQSKRQAKIILDPSRDHRDRDAAKRRSRSRSSRGGPAPPKESSSVPL